MINALLVGGSGTWSAVTYIPSIIKSKGKVKLVGIIDPVNPYFSVRTKEFSEFFKHNDVKWFETSECCNKKLVEQSILKNDIDLVIISTPPKFHFEYTLACLKCGVDVICDKPLITTEAQSSSAESAFLNVEKHNILIEAINNSFNLKADRRCFVLVPLRRRFQEMYTRVYEAVEKVKYTYQQDITSIIVSHNDGVFRFSNEVEIKKGSHGYSEGFGKLTHTGYHIIDFVAALLCFGCETKNLKCVCRVINSITVEDMLTSRSNIINRKLLQNLSSPIEISEVASKSEMDITLSYVFYRKDKKICNIIIDLAHTGKSNRTMQQYDEIFYNDQGRSNEFTMHMQQGSLFSSQMIINSVPYSGGRKGSGYTIMSYHPYVAERLEKDELKVYNMSEGKVESIVEIVMNFYDLIFNGTINEQRYYSYADFLSQTLADEMYISALIANANENKEFSWNIGKLTV